MKLSASQRNGRRMIRIDLTIPPSVNNIWNPVYKGYKKAGMVRSAEYTAWLNLAGREILVQRPGASTGEYSLEVYFHASLRGDIDNRIKALNDILQKYKVIENDKFDKRLVVDFYEDVPKNMVRIWVLPYEGLTAHNRNKELELQFNFFERQRNY